MTKEIFTRGKMAVLVVLAMGWLMMGWGQIPAAEAKAPAAAPAKPEAAGTYVPSYEDALVQKTVKPAENMTPVIPHPEEAQEAQKKLSALEKKFGKKPNILIFLMDDIGWGDPGCFGGGEAVGAPTPTMDRLAREGLMLTSCYSQPTCSPTRATIMTGRLPIRHGILRPVMYGEKGGLGNEITVARILGQAGYVTQAVGKWHMGENVESMPQNVGFDDFYGFMSVSDMYTEWRDPYFYPEIVNSPARTEMVKRAPFNKCLVHAKKGGQLENLEEITIPVLSQLDKKWGDYSVNFIKKMAKSQQPWFLYHCTRGGHFNNYPRDEYKGKSPAKYPYKDVMLELDDTLGLLVKTLQDTGQLDNTLILVTSDNGPEMEHWPDCGTTPFRGAKGDTWEGGMRVPGIVYWQGMIKPGRRSDGLFDLADLFTTSISLAGAKAKLPKDRYIDGIDQTSFLLADNGHSNRQAIFYWLEDQLSGMRLGEFKSMALAKEPSYRDTVTPGGESGKLVTYSFPKFFNLYLDPKEEHNFLVRKLVFAMGLAALQDQHLATFKKYPPKIKVK